MYMKHLSLILQRINLWYVNNIYLSIPSILGGEYHFHLWNLLELYATMKNSPWPLEFVSSNLMAQWFSKACWGLEVKNLLSEGKLVVFRLWITICYLMDKLFNFPVNLLPYLCNRDSNSYLVVLHDHWELS